MIQFKNSWKFQGKISIITKIFLANEDEDTKSLVIAVYWKIGSILCSTTSLYGLFIIAL